ncbi:hypothetical protein EDB19DRAFT_1096320 [Suillus lakei]|nr:hypothetical protein EDB19DRAFT_1096320 [Suillus lakei]
MVHHETNDSAHFRRSLIRLFCQTRRSQRKAWSSRYDYLVPAVSPGQQLVIFWSQCSVEFIPASIVLIAHRQHVQHALNSLSRTLSTISPPLVTHPSPNRFSVSSTIMTGSLEGQFIRLEVISGKNLKVPSECIPAGVYVSIKRDETLGINHQNPIIR